MRYENKTDKNNGYSFWEVLEGKFRLKLIYKVFANIFCHHIIMQFNLLISLGLVSYWKRLKLCQGVIFFTNLKISKKVLFTNE